jgi:DNA-binding NarL/FixJ family response regulator
MHAVKAGDQSRNDLTRRERQVLRLMSDGLTNNEIAERLEVSLSTVKAQVSGVISKLGASSRTEAVGMALRRHII